MTHSKKYLSLSIIFGAALSITGCIVSPPNQNQNNQYQPGANTNNSYNNQNSTPVDVKTATVPAKMPQRPPKHQPKPKLKQEILSPVLTLKSKARARFMQAPTWAKHSMQKSERGV